MIELSTELNYEMALNTPLDCLFNFSLDRVTQVKRTYGLFHFYVNFKFKQNGSLVKFDVICINCLN